MAGRKKSSSPDRNLFGCFIWTCRPEKKKKNDSSNSPSGKHNSRSTPKSTDRLKSFDDLFEALNDRIEGRKGINDIIHELRSLDGGEDHLHDDIPNSRTHNHTNHNASNSHIETTPSILSKTSSPMPLSRSPTLSRSPSRMGRAPAKSWTGLGSSTQHHAKSSKSGPLMRSGLLRKDEADLPPKNLNPSGRSARSGPLPSQRGATAIMYSKSNGLVKLPAIEKSLECSLEDLCFGCVKSITVTRDFVTNTGKMVGGEETLAIKVKPGWTKGTKITFEGTENGAQGMRSSDIIFTVTEKEHVLFRREGHDLELVMRIPLVEALTGCTLLVPLLGGETTNLTLDEIIEPGHVKIIEGQGMPKSKERGNRGDLRLTFQVEFPDNLAEDQRREIAGILQDSC